MAAAEAVVWRSVGYSRWTEAVLYEQCGCCREGDVNQVVLLSESWAVAMYV
jgi:hypothetical protein